MKTNGKVIKTTTYGYIRVSTREQNEARQVDAMEKFGVDELLMDKQSGKDFDRPAYQELLRRLSIGDTLVVKSLDRLGRDYNEMLEQWRIITKDKGAAIVVLDLPLLDTRMMIFPIMQVRMRRLRTFKKAHMVSTLKGSISSKRTSRLWRLRTALR